MNLEPLLETRQLSVRLPDRSRKPLFGAAPSNQILKGIDLQLERGESLGIVGESGSGKTTLGRTIMRLHQPTSGTIRFQNHDITHLSERELRPLRPGMQFIFQDPQSALNPRHKILVSLTQPLQVFGKTDSRRELERIARVVLERVGLPGSYIHRYPHELSGGQRQRVGIARAIVLRPQLIVADEIVSGLDVTATRRILDLLQGLKTDLDLALVFISHDLAVVKHICERVLVLHNGEVVESGPTEALFKAPREAYTRHLLSAIPSPIVEDGWLDETRTMDGSLPGTDEEFRQKMDKRFEISACTALVTGANRGIGREFVIALAKRGAAKIYAGTRSADGVDDLVKAYPGQVQKLQLDITEDFEVSQAAQQCQDVNLLINNAGINRLSAFIASDDLSSARAEMDTNYFGTLAMCRAFAPVLAENGGGAIVNLLSILARVSLPLMGSLCASKAAGLRLTQGVRAELAAQGTHVLAVMPGAVDTDMSRDFPPPKMPPAEVAEYALSALEAGDEDIYPGDMASGVAQGLQADAKGVEKDFAAYLPG